MVFLAYFFVLGVSAYHAMTPGEFLKHNFLIPICVLRRAEQFEALGNEVRLGNWTQQSSPVYDNYTHGRVKACFMTWHDCFIYFFA